MAPIAEFDSNSGRASEKWGGDYGSEAYGMRVNNPKHLGDGPQWSRQGKGNSDEGRKEEWLPINQSPTVVLSLSSIQIGT